MSNPSTPLAKSSTSSLTTFPYSPFTGEVVNVKCEDGLLAVFQIKLQQGLVERNFAKGGAGGTNTPVMKLTGTILGWNPVGEKLTLSCTGAYAKDFFDDWMLVLCVLLSFVHFLF